MADNAHEKLPGDDSGGNGPDAAALDAGEIDALLNPSGGETADDAKPASPSGEAPTAEVQRDAIAPGDIDLLLSQAEAALASVNDGQEPPPSGVSPFKLRDFSGAPPSSEAATLDLIRDVELDVSIELGRSHMYLEDVLRLRKGSVVPLDKLAGDPVDIYVNGRLIARGEILVLNDNFCVRIAELVAGESAAA